MNAAPNALYRRGQVEWALWRFFSVGRADPGRAPAVFVNRIKRLLELDRTTEDSANSDVPRSRYCFSDVAPEGYGIDVRYTPFNAFVLGLGLDLLDLGFKQGEIVFLLRHIRHDLDREYARIMRSPPSPRQRIAPEDRPACPTYEEGGNGWADCRVFMIVTKVEMTEVFPKPTRRSRDNKPVVLAPRFCRGITALREELHRMNFRYRKVLVLEVAEMAVMIQGQLEDAPEVRRGRK